MANDVDPNEIIWDDGGHAAPSAPATGGHEDITWDEHPTETAAAGDSHPGVAGSVAAGLRGIRESIPFARDIGAGASALVKGVPFEQEKKRQEAMDVRLQEEHPYSYGAGEVGGALASVAAPELAGLGAIGKGAKAEKYVAGKLAPLLGSETEAKIAAGLGSGLVGGAAQGAIHGLGTGTSLEERLGHAGEEAAIGAPLGLAGAGVGHALARGARKVGEKLGTVEALPAAATKEELLKQGRAAYDASKAAGIGIKASETRNLYKNIMRQLEDVGYDEEAHSSMKPALRRLRDIDRSASIEDLDRIMRMTKNAAKNWQKPEDQMMAAIFKKNVNDFLEDLHPTQTIGGKSGIEAVEALQEGREFWKRGRKAEIIEGIIDEAKDRAGSTGTGGNFTNLVRQAANKQLKIAKKQKNYWTPDEIQALRELARGGLGANALRSLSRLDPFHHGLIGSFEALHALTDPLGAGAAAIAGIGAHKASEKLTEGAVDRLQKIVAGGGRKSAIPSLSPMESAAARYATVPAMVAPAMFPGEDRTMRADGGKVGNRDYPAKRLTRLEKALKRAQDAIALETKPIMNMQDEHVAAALRVAEKK